MSMKDLVTRAKVLMLNKAKNFVTVATRVSCIMRQQALNNGKVKIFKVQCILLKTAKKPSLNLFTTDVIWSFIY